MNNQIIRKRQVSLKTAPQFCQILLNIIMMENIKERQKDREADRQKRPKDKKTKRQKDKKTKRQKDKKTKR